MKILAIICAYNEGDIVQSVIGELIGHGVDVYLMDNNSTDNTVDQAKKWLGRGLIHIEKFPQDAEYPERNINEFVWTDILNRKEEISATMSEYDWFIHCDADEIRESPWPDTSLRESFEFVDRQGFNAINHEVVAFVSVDDSFQPGGNLREGLRYCRAKRGVTWGGNGQVNAWKRTIHPVHLSELGGHRVKFPGIKIFPLRFLLLHYPFRGLVQAKRKIFDERIARYAQDEVEKGWHVQHRGYASGKWEIVADPDSDSVRLFDLRNKQGALLANYARESITMAALGNFDFAQLRPVSQRLIDWINYEVSDEEKIDESGFRDYQNEFVKLMDVLADRSASPYELRNEWPEVFRSPYFDAFRRLNLVEASLTNNVGVAKKMARLQRILSDP